MDVIALSRLFFSRCSPLLSPDLVWNALPSLQMCALDIAPGAVVCQIELVSLSLAILCAFCFWGGTRQSCPAFCIPLEFSMTVRATVCLALKATLGRLPDCFSMFLVCQTALRQREIMKAFRWRFSLSSASWMHIVCTRFFFLQGERRSTAPVLVVYVFRAHGDHHPYAAARHAFASFKVSGHQGVCPLVLVCWSLQAFECQSLPTACSS